MLVGVIGAGTMGSGIAQVFAQTEGYKVILVDLKKEWADNALVKIKKNLDRQVTKGRIDQEFENTILNSITTSGDKHDCKDCDLIVEAASENPEIKIATFKELNEICKPECLFTTNTSSLSVTEIAAPCGRDVVGMHFFNPAPVMKLIEVIKGENTTDEHFEEVNRIAKEVGKTPVEINEAPGFVANRILMPMINEAIGIYAEGVASIEGIDTAMKLGANHPMGPLELADLVGLDIVLAILKVLWRETGDPKYAPNYLLKKMVRGGKLGVKSGEGFYKYNDK